MDDKPNSLRSLSEVQIKSDGLISIESYFTYSTSIWFFLLVYFKIIFNLLT